MRHPGAAGWFAENGQVFLFPPQVGLLLRPFYSRRDKRTIALLPLMLRLFPRSATGTMIKELWLYEPCSHRLGKELLKPKRSADVQRWNAGYFFQKWQPLERSRIAAFKCSPFAIYRRDGLTLP